MTADERRLYDAIVAGPRAAEPAFTLVAEDGSLRGPFDAMLLAPAIGQALQQLGSALRFSGTLSPRLRELAILCVAGSTQSAFERSAHAAVGRRVGLSPGQVSAAIAGDGGRFTEPAEQTVVRLSLELARGHRVDDELFERARAHIGLPGVFELSTLVGYYRLLATQLDLFQADEVEPAEAREERAVPARPRGAPGARGGGKWRPRL